jgi:thioesterase domain-containing protein/acyl carrier protein
MVPSRIIEIGAVPLSANGKADRKELYNYVERQIQDVAVEAQPDYLHTELSLRVCETLAQLLNVEVVHPSQDLFELGAHSLLMVNLQQKLAHQFGVSLSLNSLFNKSSIGDLISLVEEEGGSIRFVSTVREISDTATSGRTGSIPFLMPLANVKNSVTSLLAVAQTPTLYCIHPASGFSGPFQSIADAMSSYCNVVGVNATQALGTGRYQDSIDAIAADYADQIQKQHTSGDYYFLGWSLGGHLAVAITRILEARGERVRWLGVIDSLLKPEYIAVNEGVGTVEQDLKFYLNSLQLLGVGPLSAEKIEQLHGLIAENPSNHSNRVCAWAEQQKLFASSLVIPYLSTMLDLIDQGKKLVHLVAVEQHLINSDVAFYWASETLNSIQNVGEMIEDSHGITSKNAYSRTFQTNHQAIIKDRAMINNILNDVTKAVAEGQH